MPERDPVRDLEDFALPGDGMDRPSAAEVRRAGDRRRRRRNVGTVLGTAAAVAVVALGGSLLLADPLPGPDPAGPTPTPSESPSDGDGVDAVVPEDFPLQRGWPDATGSDAVLEGPSRDTASILSADGELADACDGDALPSPDRAGRTTARLLLPDEVRTRELMVFPGPDGARAWADAARLVLEDCGPSADPDLPGARRTTGVAELHPPVGDTGWEARRGLTAASGPVPGRELVQVTVLGPVVLVDFGSDAGTGLDPMSEEYQRRARPVLTAICERFEDACPPPASGDGSSALPAYPTSLAEAPASEVAGQGEVPDWDLGRGLPDMTGDGGELLGPQDHVQGVDRLLVCGEPAIDQDLEITGRLAVSSSGPETLMYRQVIAYPDAEVAQRQLEHLRALVRGCPRHATEDGTLEVVWTEVGTASGYDSFTAGWTFAAPGAGDAGATGGELVQLTRVGRAVLVVGHAGEWAGPESLRQGAVRVEETSLRFAGWLCEFTEAGC